MMEGQPAEKAAGSSPLEEEASQPAEKSEENIPKPKKSTSMSEENIPQRTSEPTSEVNTPKAAKKSSKPSEKTPVSGQSPGEPTLSPSSPFWGPFKAGWVRELVYRSNVGPNNKRADAYYKSPVGKKYRSLKEIERAIDEGKPGFGGLDVNNFTFNQYPLGVGDPSKEIIRGSDPNRQFNHAKRPSEAGESDSPVKKPKRMSAKLVPRTSTETPPKRKVVTAPPKNVPAVLQEAAPRPATLPVVTPPRPYPQTAVRSQIRPYKQQVVGPRTMGFGSGIRPIATNLLMNRTVQKVKTKAFSNAALPPSPQKSTEEIVCEPAIYEGEDAQLPAEVIMDSDVDHKDSTENQSCGGSPTPIETESNSCDGSEKQSCGEYYLQIGIKSNGLDCHENGDVDDERTCRENGEESILDPCVENGTVDSCDAGAVPSSEPDSTTQCLCGMCVVPVTNEKIVCCAVHKELVEVKTSLRCITFHPSFEKLILDEDVLDMTRHLLCLKTKNVTKKAILNAEEPMNITWRYVAYKQFILWVNKCLELGMQNKVAIPSCVVQAVRVRFPERNGIGRSPEKPTISSALQAMTQKTATPTPARVYQKPSDSEKAQPKPMSGLMAIAAKFGIVPTNDGNEEFGVTRHTRITRATKIALSEAKARLNLSQQAGTSKTAPSEESEQESSASEANEDDEYSQDDETDEGTQDCPPVTRSSIDDSLLSEKSFTRGSRLASNEAKARLIATHQAEESSDEDSDNVEKRRQKKITDKSYKGRIRGPKICDATKDKEPSEEDSDSVEDDRHNDKSYKGNIGHKSRYTRYSSCSPTSSSTSISQITKRITRSVRSQHKAEKTELNITSGTEESSDEEKGDDEQEIEDERGKKDKGSGKKDDKTKEEDNEKVKGSHNHKTTKRAHSSDDDSKNDIEPPTKMESAGPNLKKPIDLENPHPAFDEVIFQLNKLVLPLGKETLTWDEQKKMGTDMMNYIHDLSVLVKQPEKESGTSKS